MVYMLTRKAMVETNTKAIDWADWESPIIFPCTSRGAAIDIRFNDELIANTAKNAAMENNMEKRVKLPINCMTRRHSVIIAKPIIPTVSVEKRPMRKCLAKKAPRVQVIPMIINQVVN